MCSGAVDASFIALPRFMQQTWSEISRAMELKVVSALQGGMGLQDDLMLGSPTRSSTFDPRDAVRLYRHNEHFPGYTGHVPR
jgi:hypothetical protein